MNELDLKQLTLFRVDSRVSHLAWLASKEDLMTNDTYGQKCYESSEKLDLLGFSVKMYLESCRLQGGQYVRDWSISDTLSPYLIMKLRLSEQRTDENECSLWGKHTATGSARSPEYLEGRSITPAEYARMFPIPTAQDYKRRAPNSKQQGLPEIVHNGMWATPNTMDNLPARTGEKMQDLLDRNGKNKPSNLREHVVPENMSFWRTPDAHCERGAKSEETFKRKLDEGMPININDQVVHGKLWPTSDAKAARKPNTLLKSGRSATKAVSSLGDAVNHSDTELIKQNKSGQLNPEWVEQLMGFPRGWTECAS